MKMYDNDNMDDFIAEQKARLAHERQALDKNPTSAVSEYILNDEVKKPSIPDNLSRHHTNNLATKENSLRLKPPTPQLLKLGEAYKEHKEKLKEELRQEYRQALAEKQVRNTGVRGKMGTSYEKGLAVNNNDFGLSLPLRDHLSAKERLRLERNREYNQFKADKENQEKMRSPRPLKTFATPITYPQANSNIEPPVPEPRIAESYQDILARKRAQERTYRNKSGPDDDNKRGRIARKLVEDDDERFGNKKVTLARKRRPRYIEYHYDEDDEDYDEDETEEELIERLRARRQRRRRAKLLLEDDADDGIDDDMAFRRVRHREDPTTERRRLGSAQDKSKATADKQNDLRSRSAPPEQEFTGLPIGKVASANTVHRRKAEYKEELTKQMEEDRQRRLREKQLDKESGAPPSDKKQRSHPGRQQEFKKRVEIASVDSDEDLKVKRKGKRSTRRLDSSDSDSERDRRHRRSRPPFPPYYNPSVMNGLYPPPAPSMSYPSFIDDAYYYYGSQNPLHPGVPPGGIPQQRSFNPGISPLLAAADSKQSGFSDTVKEGNYHNTSLPVQVRSSKAADLKSSLVSDETRDAQKKKEMMQVYQEELMEQMKIKEKKKAEEKRERELYEKKKEFEAANYDPWGKGGGGAPMKDTHGNLISDLRQMHLQNEELVRDPTKVVELAKQRQRAIENAEEVFQTPRKQDTEMFAMSPRFGRNNPFEQKESVEQRTIKGTYKDELRKQIEEKKRLDEERKEQLRIMEEKEERRMVEDARKMQEEYDNEQKKQREKIEEQRRKNEEIQKALAEKREEEEKRKREEQRKREEEERAVKERELDAKLKRQPAQSQPNVPDKDVTPRPQPRATSTLQEQRKSESVRREVAVQVHKPPSAARSYNETPTSVGRVDKSRESKRISRELSALRKQLLNEQQRIEDQLRDTEHPRYSTYQPDRMRTDTLVDLSRTRQRPVHVRRPPTVDRPNSKALREFREYKDRQDDTTSLRMFRIQHPDTPADTQTLEQQQEDLIKSQMMKIEALKHNTDPRRGGGKLGGGQYSLLPPSESYASLLDADTTYIPVPDETPLQRAPSDGRKLSARERRRAKKNDEEGGITYRATPDNYSVQSLNSLATLDIERIAGRNQTRMNRLKEMQGDDISTTNPDDILERFINQQQFSSAPETPDPLALHDRKQRKGTSISAPQAERPPSVNTVDTELWLRPGTGPPATAT